MAGFSIYVPKWVRLTILALFLTAWVLPGLILGYFIWA